jgi:transposase
MLMIDQPVLPAMSEPTEPAAAHPIRPTTRPSEARLVRPVRNQIEWAPRELDAALPPDHPARAIWAVLEQLDLSAFYTDIKAVADRPGRPASDPKVLLALWLFATKEGVGSARHLARLCEAHDAYRWIRGGVPVDYHLLAEFRVVHEHALDDLFTTILAAMMNEGLVTLDRVAQDGMKVRASAGAASFRGAASLDQCLTAAKEQVERTRDQREHPEPGVSAREQAARERAARERQERVQRALQQLPAAKAAKARQERTLAKPKRAKVREPRVSTTDPDARVMHMPDGGFRPALNAEFATDVGSQVIVGLGVSNQGSDQGQALPMETQVHERTDQHPGAYLMDGGFVKRDDITALEQGKVIVYAPLRQPRTTTSGRTATDPRPDDSPEVIAWRERMGTDEAKEIYKQRAATAECVNALARLRGLQQFRVRGPDKALCVLLLLAITHNLLRWITLSA